MSQGNYRGYIPFGFFTPNGSAEDADQYEGFKLHTQVDRHDPIIKSCSLYGPNKWPAGASNFDPVVQRYWRECDRLCNTLLHVVAQFLEVDASIFSRAFEKPLTNMTLLHYPPSDKRIGDFGIHPHTDTDVLTILAPDPSGGLFLRQRNSSQWVEANAPAQALIVNVGDMLEIWSGGRFVSTPHKVENREGNERYSFPYFAVPRFDVTIEPIVDKNASDFDRASMHVGDVSAKIWQSNWPESGPVDSNYDPYVNEKTEISESQ